MNTGPKGWVGMSTPVIQGDSWPSLGQAFAFASPDGFLVAWSWLLCAWPLPWSKLCFEVEELRSQGISGNIHNLQEPPWYPWEPFFFHMGPLGCSEMVQFLEQQRMATTHTLSKDL